MDSAASAYGRSITLLPPVPAGGLPWQRWLSALLSIALLGSFAAVLHGEGLARLRGALPASPIFWLAFALYYLALPASEWVIYHRLWNLPASAFAALLRKLVSNELLLGYSGELSFYLYARREAKLEASPFHAIKDVSVLSALAGNLATLGMALLAWPIWARWAPGLLPSGTIGSLAALALVSAVLVFFRRKVFSLDSAKLRMVMGVHLVRLAATSLLMVVMWKSALPAVPATMWLALAALQLVVTRLPLIPNKDLVFAGAVMFITGAASAVGALIAVITSLLIAAHVVTGLTLLGASALDRLRAE